MSRLSKCPICNSSQIVLECQINKYIYFKCLNCLVLFLNPIPTKTSINKIYETNYSYKIDCLTTERIKSRSQKIVNNLIRLNPKGLKLLDVGPGHGYILRSAKIKNLSCYGVEPSLELSSILKKKYVNIFNTTIEKFIENNSNRYDFITLVHVIEHLKNPRKVLNGLTKLLNHNGVIYIETPNLDSFLFYVERCQYTFLTPPEHIYIFSNKSISKFFNDQLFRLKLSTYSYPEHFIGIIKRKFTNKKNDFTEVKKKINNDINKNIKILIINKFLSKLFYRALNINNKGAFLEYYIQFDIEKN